MPSLGAPDAPSMPGATPGRRVSGGMPRITFFEWREIVIGPLRAVTPKEGQEVKNLSEAEHVREALGLMDAARRGDTRPVLIYFHWPHEDATHGRVSDALCSRILNDEDVARWGKLFRCVQVDMGQSEEKFSALAGAGSEPSFVVMDSAGKIVARIEAEKSSVKLRKALEAAIDRVPAYRKEIQRRLKEQEAQLDEARRLEKADDLEEALKLVDQVRFSDLRIGKHYDRAMAYGQTLAQKLESSR